MGAARKSRYREEFTEAAYQRAYWSRVSDGEPGAKFGVVFDPEKVEERFLTSDQQAAGFAIRALGLKSGRGTVRAHLANAAIQAEQRAEARFDTELPPLESWG